MLSQHLKAKLRSYGLTTHAVRCNTMPLEQTRQLVNATRCSHRLSNQIVAAATRSSWKRGIVADSLAEGARGCKRMHEPGKMSARFRLEDAFGMASAKPVRSSGVFIRMSRHLSSCTHARLLVLSEPTDTQKGRSCCRSQALLLHRTSVLDFGRRRSNSHLAKSTI
jgi:hypothetical protein